MSEDRSSRLAAKLLDGEPNVLASSQHRLALLDERTNERAQLVQRGPASLNVLLEGEREIPTLLQLAPEHHERSEDEPAKERVEMRCAHGHVSGYATRVASPASGSRDLDPETGDATEVRFVAIADENSVTEMNRSCGYLKVVRRNRIATSAQIREQIGPPLGDLTSKIHERNPSHERGEPPAPNCSAGRTARHARANEQLCIDDRRQNRGLPTRADEHGVPVGTSAFHRNGRTRVDYEAQGSSGGRSAAFTRSRASANSGSGPPTELQAANASRTVVTEASATGVTRATGSPLRSTTNESPR
jgi:hypothetical protein